MSQQKLRSNFVRGSFLWAVRNAQWQAMGIPEEDCEKPKIAIVNSSSGISACFSHLDAIVPVLKEQIRAAGGVPFEIRTIAPSDFIIGAGAGGSYMLASRDLITNDIEAAVEGALLDGMVCLASCDKTAPGQLMAAARLNIPTVIVACGYQPSGVYRGKSVDIEDLFVSALHAQVGRIDTEEIVEMSREAIGGPGVCAGMGTANSMHIATEALGMALPGTTPVQANSEPMWATVRAAGTQIMQLVNDDTRPRDILTAAAFRNAVSVLLAIGGSINCIKHLQAVATEAECEVDVFRLFDELGSRIPMLVGVRPLGDQTIGEFEDAGGCLGLMKQLEPLLDLSARSVNGKTLGHNLRDAVVKLPHVIRPLGDPLTTYPSIMMLKGSLAPGFGVVKNGVGGRLQQTFDGVAICFDIADEAIKAIVAGTVRDGHVLILRGAGPCGGPAMGGGSSRVVFAMDGAELGEGVAMVTDGQVSGLVCKGLVVAEVSPEAVTGGPLALVQDGDRITINLTARSVDLHVADAELAKRSAEWIPPAKRSDRGWLRIYRRSVGALTKGAVLADTSEAASS